MKKHINLNIELLYMFATICDLVFFLKAKICKILTSQNKNEKFVHKFLIFNFRSSPNFQEIYFAFFFSPKFQVLNPQKIIGEIFLPIFKNFLKTCHQLTLIFSFGDGCQPFPC
jgi:hypothetical protein